MGSGGGQDAIPIVSLRDGSTDRCWIHKRLSKKKNGSKPRIRDLHLASILGFSDLHKIRALIRRCLKDVSKFEVIAIVAETSQVGGRPGTEYWLTEEQALLAMRASRSSQRAHYRLLGVFG
jgi:hypothetical protein